MNSGSPKHSEPVDAGVRKRALDPTGSFIVQAPAGSGKTELLTRRVLALLATVDEPESVLAITFTRKAASEMRHRVVEALRLADRGEPPGSAYEAEGRALAAAVLQRDATRGWRLLEQPQRLNLRTIDGLCTQLAYRLPVVSTLGAPAAVVDDARVLYREAAARLLDDPDENLDRVLLQLGNRLDDAESLLADLLARRDQWARHRFNAGDADERRAELEQQLSVLVSARLDALRASIAPELAASLAAALDRSQRTRVALGLMPADAAGNVPGSLEAALIGSTGRFSDEAGADRQGFAGAVPALELPGTEPSDVPRWQALADLLLTKAGDLRKSVTKAQGFPVAKADAERVGVSVDELKARKQALGPLFEAVAAQPALVAAIGDCRTLPAGGYSDDDWSLLDQLLGALPALQIYLHDVFQSRGVIDFVEMSQRALLALGTDDEPTDLALALDLQLQHLLVDEFQDTSQSQFSLFRSLVAGWTPEDGRTFFAVGDPMQSIYRFRDADVSLFEQARTHGVGEVKLEALVLSVNFRAAPGLIDWINEAFADIFPPAADQSLGAVPYAPSAAHGGAGGLVAVHPLIDSDRDAEAARVAELTAAAIAPGIDHTVAILLRSRTQAVPVFAALQARNIAYQAIDMDVLGNRPVVRDLLSLTQALRYPHDRVHWLAVLRAPWCALTLGDLHVLVADEPRVAVMTLLRDADRVAQLSEDGQARVQRLLRVLEPAVRRAPRTRVVAWVEACWLALGGPVLCEGPVDFDAAERTLQRLQRLEADGELWQPGALSNAMATLFAAPDSQTDSRVQIMTLHKAKGLEFDTVIVPALDRQPRGDSRQLLNWFEASVDGEPLMLLAPFTERNAEVKPLNELVRHARRQADAQEKLRLLYVACTRARHALHLVAQAKHTAEGHLGEPREQSLLHPLWPRLQAEFKAAAQVASARAAPPAGLTPLESGEQSPVAADKPAQESQLGSTAPSVEPLHAGAPALQRLPTAWAAPTLAAFQWPAQHTQAERVSDSVHFQWAGSVARDVGTVVHRQLQAFAEQPAWLERLSGKPEQVAEVLADALEHRVTLQLQRLGVPAGALVDARSRVLLALRNTLIDERGRWVLDARHEKARTEWALTARLGNDWQRVVVDRTFIDADGTRWIVDFKTGDHAGGDVAGFLDDELTRYQKQLQRYADIIGRMEQRPLRAGLYFPMLCGWREFRPVSAS